MQRLQQRIVHTTTTHVVVYKLNFAPYSKAVNKIINKKERGAVLLSRTARAADRRGCRVAGTLHRHTVRYTLHTQSTVRVQTTQYPACAVAHAATPTGRVVPASLRLPVLKRKLQKLSTPADLLLVSGLRLFCLDIYTYIYIYILIILFSWPRSAVYERLQTVHAVEQL